MRVFLRKFLALNLVCARKSPFRTFWLQWSQERRLRLQYNNFSLFCVLIIFIFLIIWSYDFSRFRRGFVTIKATTLYLFLSYSSLKLLTFWTYGSCCFLAAATLYGSSGLEEATVPSRRWLLIYQTGPGDHRYITITAICHIELSFFK